MKKTIKYIFSLVVIFLFFTLSPITWAGSNDGCNISDSGNLKTYTCNDPINTSGENAIDATGDDDVRVNSTGEIVTQGSLARGIYATSNNLGNTVTIDSSSDVTTSGNSSSGVYAGGNGRGNGKLGENVTVNNTGDINTNGDISYGIVALTTSGSIAIDNGGDITTNGSSSTGIYGYNGLRAVSINNSGNVKTAGSNANGLFVGYGRNSSASTSITNQSSGEVTSTGNNSSAIQFGGVTSSVANTQNVFTNHGTVNGVIKSYGGKDTINNTGTIDTTFSESEFHQHNDTFTNQGVLKGTFNMGEGDDAVNLYTQGNHTNAAFKGGDGQDTLNLFGTGSNYLNLSTLDSIESLNGKSGQWTLQGSSTLDAVNEGADFIVSSNLTVNLGSYTAKSGSKTRFNLLPTSSGKIIAGDIDFKNGSIIDLNIKTGITIANGKKYTLVSGSGSVSDNSTLTDNSALYDFEKSLENGKDIVVTTKQALSILDENLAKVNDAVQKEVTIAASALGTLSTNTEVMEGLEDLTPNDSGADLSALNNMPHTIFNTVPKSSNSQTASLIPLPFQGRKQAWAKLYGLYHDQNRIIKDNNTYNGSKGRGGGIAFGLNVPKNDEMIWGISASYGKMFLDEDQTSNDTDITTLGIFAHSGKKFNDVLLEVHGGLWFHDITTKRHIALLGEESTGDTNALQNALRIKASKVVNHNSNLDMQPEVSLSYTNLKKDSYSERGSSASLSYDDETRETLVARAGLTVGTKRDIPQGTLHIELYGGALYEALDKDTNTTASFLGGSDVFLIKTMDQKPLGGEAKLHLTLDRGDGMRFSAGYNGTFQENSKAHGGELSMRWTF